LERHTRDLCELEQRLKQIPDEEHLKSAFDGLGEKHKEVASLEQELLTKDQEISLLQGEISRLVREKEKQRESIDRSAQANGRLQLVENCGKALAEYKLQLIRLKVKTLEREITGCLKKLMRKEDLVHHVEIDPENFVIRLFDSRGQELLKKELSAGEKQMYAVAVLWGLACASGRNMPIIIDTPLGRLDSEHRRLLIENYFPHVSHQTIILSTDTEIDRLLFNALGKNISHAYHLVYDAASGLVKPENGYFWEQEVAYA
jgi:DNA sulfur modification protein DndD